ncbi:hypothetical protein [Microvirga flavescens]|uniref:hypothetical protein n=1 Tax=Microvirga flavescens TaxID=2249811 RepID=UPI001300920A|nr:hypothetical protein [Microvirga flavescens]
MKNGIAPENDDVTVERGPPLRVFCPMRHEKTTLLTQMIEGLFAKPASRVSLTMENNWTVFHLYAEPEHQGDPRYCAFFRMRRSTVPLRGEQVPLEMFVESGYGRSTRVKVLRHAPFGRVAEETAFNVGQA